VSARRLETLAVAFTCAALLGCSGVPVHMGLKKGERLPAGRSRDIASGACGFQVVFAYFPLGFALNGRLARAYEGLERQADGDAITDVEISEEWHYAFVGTSYCTKLRARAIHPTANSAPAPVAAPSIPVPETAPAMQTGPVAPPPAPAISPPPAAPAPVPPATPGTLEKGATARLKPGGMVRTRPRPEGDPVDLDPAPAVTLGLRLSNENGSWWYVSSGGKSGWVLESDLEPMAP
jgi:hypothetical protein